MVIIKRTVIQNRLRAVKGAPHMSEILKKPKIRKEISALRTTRLSVGRRRNIGVQNQNPTTPKCATVRIEIQNCEMESEN